MSKRDLTNLQVTGGAIIRFMKYASTQADMAACGHALHRVIRLHEQHKEAMRVPKVPEVPKVIERDGTGGHTWSNEAPSQRVCQDCGATWRESTGTLCPVTTPEPTDTKHDWAPDFASGLMYCTHCDVPKRNYARADLPCPGKVLDPETSGHDWSDLPADHPECTRCGVRKANKALAGLPCGSKSSPYE